MWWVRADSSRTSRLLLATSVGVLLVLAGCRSGDEGRDRQGLYGTGEDEIPTEVLDAYETMAGRPFPDDVDVLGWRYNYGWLDDGVFFVTETTAERADELAALEEDDQPGALGPTGLSGVSDERVDAALERSPIRSYEHQGIGVTSHTTIMGDDDVVTVVLEAFEF